MIVSKKIGVWGDGYLYCRVGYMEEEELMFCDFRRVYSWLLSGGRRAEDWWFESRGGSIL